MNKIKIIFPWVHVRLILFHLLQIFHCLTSPDRKSFLLDSEYSFSELGVIVIKIFCTISGEYFLLFMIILYESNTLCSYILLDIKYPVPFRTKMKIFYLSTSTSMLLMFNFMYLNDFVIIFFQMGIGKLKNVWIITVLGLIFKDLLNVWYGKCNHHK